MLLKTFLLLCILSTAGLLSAAPAGSGTSTKASPSIKLYSTTSSKFSSKTTPKTSYAPTKSTTKPSSFKSSYRTSSSSCSSAKTSAYTPKPTSSYKAPSSSGFSSKPSAARAAATSTTARYGSSGPATTGVPDSPLLSTTLQCARAINGATTVDIQGMYAYIPRLGTVFGSCWSTSTANGGSLVFLSAVSDDYLLADIATVTQGVSGSTAQGPNMPTFESIGHYFGWNPTAQTLSFPGGNLTAAAASYNNYIEFDGETAIGCKFSLLCVGGNCAKTLWSDNRPKQSGNPQDVPLPKPSVTKLHSLPAPTPSAILFDAIPTGAGPASIGTPTTAQKPPMCTPTPQTTKPTQDLAAPTVPDGIDGLYTITDADFRACPGANFTAGTPLFVHSIAQSLFTFDIYQKTPEDFPDAPTWPWFATNSFFASIFSPTQFNEAFPGDSGSVAVFAPTDGVLGIYIAREGCSLQAACSYGNCAGFLWSSTAPDVGFPPAITISQQPPTGTQPTGTRSGSGVPYTTMLPMPMAAPAPAAPAAMQRKW
ncbi:hypothetical protein DFJ73DRAFT_829833 [Zopfochytrium polystomum]|nr:hypothetical protein DFJ73DRAFT_829833 [Zopfochytrium polystomum]